MNEGPVALGRGPIEGLILQSLIRSLLAKGILSVDELRSLLFDAASRLEPVSGQLTPEATRKMVDSELVPIFVDRSEEVEQVKGE